MARNRYDQASRYGAKMDPPGFLCWLLRVPALPLPFRGWLDTRTLPFPGEPDRTCDTVAELGEAGEPHSWALPVEFCLAPDPALPGRLLAYLGLLWLERQRNQPEVAWSVGAVVVNLTGAAATSR